MKILLVQLLVIFCCVSSLYASTNLKSKLLVTKLKAQTFQVSQASFIDQNKLYYIRGLQSNKYLNYIYSQPYAQIYNWSGSQTQQWKFDFSSGSYYQIRSSYDTELVLTCENNSGCKGLPVASGSSKQKFVVEEYTGPEKNPYGSTAKMVALKSVDFGTYLGAANTNEGLAPNLWTANTGIQNSKFSVGQIWILEEVSGSFPAIPSIPFSLPCLRGNYPVYLRNLNSGKYLTLLSSGQYKVGHSPLTGAQTQKWLFRYNDAGYRIVTVQNTSVNLDCSSLSNCVTAADAYTNSYSRQRWQVIEYNGPEIDPAGGRRVVLRELDFNQYLGVGALDTGYPANLYTANDGLNGSKFSKGQIWVLEQAI